MGECNGCHDRDLRRRLGKRYLLLDGRKVYELDAQPEPGQSEPHKHLGRPIRLCAIYMALEHSYDEDCRLTRPTVTVHYANRKDTGCDPAMGLVTGCDITLQEVARRGEQAAEDIARVTCADCRFYFQMLADKRARKKGDRS